MRPLSYNYLSCHRSCVARCGCSQTLQRRVPMRGIQQSFAQAVLIAILAGASSAQPVPVTIDTTRTGLPITKLMFGGFMEPATTQLWAEMLADRKFFNEINSKPAPASTGGFGRRGPQRRW